MRPPTFASHEDFLRTKYFPSLDGLRCLSILMVIGFHARLTNTTIFAEGREGVALFFVISGFLITTLLLRERAKYGDISLRDFYVRRTLRIFPLYYAALILYTVLVLVTQNGPERDAFFRNLLPYTTYTSNWFVDRYASERVIFAFSWSLATEEQFYLVWPFVVRYARRWFVPVILVGVALVTDMALEHYGKIHMLGLGPTGRRIMTSVASPICLGCLLAYAMNSPKGFAIVRYVVGAAWSSVVALLLCAGAYALGSHPVMYACMALLVGAVCVRTDNWLRPLLSNPVVKYVGTISYGMYLLHMLCLNATLRLTEDRGWALLIGATLLTVAVASVSYWLYERPFLQLKERFSRRPRTEKPSVPAVATPAGVATQAS